MVSINQTGAANVKTSNISTLLIANRGEIACRVIRTAKRMGMRSVAVYSTADSNAQHVRDADVSVCIGGAQPNESYLNIAAIIAAAKQTGANAIHPGYGFLSENPEFVEACQAEDIVFVGPDAPAMRSMGLKDAAKALMEKAGVPVVPGYHGNNQDTAFLKQEADRIGYPVLIKARAGGGGKGMRKVDRADKFNDSLEAAQREGKASFGDASVLIEKYIEQPRHIEVQVFGDRHGGYVHLFERDCSLQRRHQKVIEEAPAPGMSDEVRAAMTEAAIRTAQSIDYVGAGTVEFIVDASGPLRTDGFWFMEMNTRLQVEHPVTEAVTGFDLVEWQLLVAAGQALPVSQSQIQLNGHSVEARLYAEDVAAGFLPATGTLHRFNLGEQGRVDTGVVQGDVVQPFYDPMLAKLISHGRDRQDAFRRLHRMLDQSVVMGVTTNRAFLADLCINNEVLSGQVHTGLIEQQQNDNASNDLGDAEASNALVFSNLALAAILYANHSALTNSSETAATHQHGVFSRLGQWQMWGTPKRLVDLQVNQTPVTLSVERLANSRWRASLVPMPHTGDNGENAASNESNIEISIESLNALSNGTLIQVNNQTLFGVAFIHGNTIFSRVGDHDERYSRPVIEHTNSGASAGAQLIAPMPGRIIAVNCNAGDTVSEGDVLMTLEAMKMEHNLVASEDVRIESVFAEVGDQVEQGARLITFDKG